MKKLALKFTESAREPQKAERRNTFTAGKCTAPPHRAPAHVTLWQECSVSEGAPPWVPGNAIPMNNKE